MTETSTTIEVRIRRLEQQVARWRLAGAAAALLGGALAWQACSKEQKLPERIELSDGSSTLTMSASGIELGQGDRKTILAPASLSLQGVAQDRQHKAVPATAEIAPGALAVHTEGGGGARLAHDGMTMGGDAGDVELRPGMLAITRGDHRLRAELHEERGAELRVSHEKARTYALLHADVHGTAKVDAHTMVPDRMGPGNGASLFASVTEAAVSASRGTAEKSLGLK